MSKVFHIFATRKTFTFTHSHSLIHTHSFTHIECFSKVRDIYQQRASSMKWRFDKDKVEGTFKGVDSDINREELQRMAAEEGIELNFERWDKLIRDIRLEQSSDTNDAPNDSCTKPKYVYNFDGQLIKTFKTTKECAEFYGISREAVALYARSERPYYKLGIVISNELKDEKHKPYVRKRRLWFNNMFNEQNH